MSIYAFPFCQKVVISEVMAAVEVSACHYSLCDRSFTDAGSLVCTMEHVAFRWLIVFALGIF